MIKWKNLVEVLEVIEEDDKVPCAINYQECTQPLVTL